MEISTSRYIRITIRIHSFIPSSPKVGFKLAPGRFSQLGTKETDKSWAEFNELIRRRDVSSGHAGTHSSIGASAL